MTARSCPEWEQIGTDEPDTRHEDGMASESPLRTGYQVPWVKPAPMASSFPLSQPPPDPQPFNPNFQTSTGLTDWINVKAIGARGDGSTDDTGPLQAAHQISAIKGLPVYYPAGNYMFSGPVLLAPGAVVRGSGPQTRLFFTGSGDAFQFYGGVKPPGGFAGIPNMVLAGGLYDLTIDGFFSSTSAPSTGLHMGSGIGFNIDRTVFITNFAGTPNSVGLHLDNGGETSPAPWYTEKARIQVKTANCGIHILFDVTTSTQPSFEYNDVTAYLLFVESFQAGIVFKDGAYMAGGSLIARGNFDTNNQALGGTIGSLSNLGTLANIATWNTPSPGQLAVANATGPPAGLAYVATNTGLALISYTGIVTGASGALTGCQYIGGAPVGTVATGGAIMNGGAVLSIISDPTITPNVSFLQDNFIDITVEANNSRSNGPNTVVFGQNLSGGGQTPNTFKDCMGLLSFRLSPWTASNVAAGQFTFGGIQRNDANLAAVNTKPTGWL